MRALVLPVVLAAALAPAQQRADAQPTLPPLVEELLWGTRRWEDGAARLFFAEQLDVGYVYVRARSFFGYGRPHDLWGGLEVTPLFNLGGLGAFVGLAGALRYVQARVGARPMLSLQHPVLTPAAIHERVEIQGPKPYARFVTLEAELQAEGVVGPVRLLALGTLATMQGTRLGVDIYDETLRIIAPAGGLIWRARGEVGLRFMPGKQHEVGLVVDVLGVPVRGELQVRAGVQARLVLSPFLEARLTLAPTVFQRDRLGLVTSDFSELGLRWRFATGQ